MDGIFVSAFKVDQRYATQLVACSSAAKFIDQKNTEHVTYLMQTERHEGVKDALQTIQNKLKKKKIAQCDHNKRFILGRTGSKASPAKLKKPYVTKSGKTSTQSNHLSRKRLKARSLVRAA